ncbi:hypothetical protein DV737_g1391, partial [Chaetothyriales sp. CBS 132003]
MDLAKSGADALAASDPATAVTQYTKALLVHPASPDYLTQRATAFARLKPPRYDLALKDAEVAVLCGRKRSSRKHIQAAQLRRVVGLYHNGRYAEAKYVLGTMQKWLPREGDGDDRLKAAMSGSDKKISMEAKIWESKVTKRLAEHPQPEFTSRDEYPEGTDKDIADATLLKLYKNKAQIDIQDDSLSVSFPQPSDPTAVFSFTLDPLHALIDAGNSTAKIMSTKVEITLKKAAPGVKWPVLEGTEPLQKRSTSSTSDPVAKAAILSSLHFFKKLYKGADPDTRRAMMKSFQESNGTALSTNWAEVGNKHYDPVEEKKDD